MWSDTSDGVIIYIKKLTVTSLLYIPNGYNTSTNVYTYTLFSYYF